MVKVLKATEEFYRIYTDEDYSEHDINVVVKDIGVNVNFDIIIDAINSSSNEIYFYLTETFSELKGDIIDVIYTYLKYFDHFNTKNLKLIIYNDLTLKT